MNEIKSRASLILWGISSYAQFEEREYEADLNWACTEATVPSSSSDGEREVQSSQFWKLFRYISGENVEGKES